MFAPESIGKHDILWGMCFYVCFSQIMELTSTCEEIVHSFNNLYIVTKRPCFNLTFCDRCPCFVIDCDDTCLFLFFSPDSFHVVCLYFIFCFKFSVEHFAQLSGCFPEVLYEYI